MNSTSQRVSSIRTNLLLFLMLILMLVSTVVTHSQDGSRQIVLEEFTRARPTGSSAGNKKSKGPNSTSASAQMNASKIARYRRATKALTPDRKSTRLPNSEIGITIWRLRPSRSEDSANARLLVMQNNKETQWTPERIEADASLKVGDRVRISIEAPRAGYLYVVDREQYTDGSLGDAYLIFPTKRTRNGDNRARPGRLIDIPAQEDNPNHFTLVPSPTRQDQVGEVLSIILTPQPLPLDISDKPLQISNNDILDWERLWGAQFERFEMEGGAGLAWTKEEKDASASKGSRQLTQAEPTPQTIYRLAPTKQNSLLITVRLNYSNR